MEFLNLQTRERTFKLNLLYKDIHNENEKQS